MPVRRQSPHAPSRNDQLEIQLLAGLNANAPGVRGSISGIKAKSGVCT